MGQLFEVTLDDGNLTGSNGFDSTSGTGLSAIAPGLVATEYCMAVAISDGTARYGQVAVGSNQSQIRLFLSLDTNGITMASGDVFTVALCRDNSGNDVFRVELGYDSSAGYRVRPGIRTDGGTWSDGAWVNISDNEHMIEVEWSRASGAGQNDGSIELWVEVYDVADFGTADSSLTGVDNDTKYARVFRFGAPAGLDSGTSGTIWVDHFEANDDDTPVGHPGTLIFEGAVGAGRYTQGGTGGTVYEVTTLNDSGTGSLRAALEASGAREINVKIDGNIILTSRIQVDNPYFTLNGQTPSGGGLCVRNYPVQIRTHNWYVNHMRFRLGDLGGGDDSLAITNASDSGSQVYNGYLRNCSISWGLDEDIEIYNNDPPSASGTWIKNITIDHCIISEGLDIDAHSMGLLIASSPHEHCIKNITLYSTLFVHNRQRNPRVTAVSPIEIINCVMHDCPGFVFLARYVATHLNFIGNTVVTQSSDFSLLFEPHLGPSEPVSSYLVHQVYVDDNVGNYFDSEDPDDWDFVGKGWGTLQAATGDFRTAWEVSSPAHIANSELTATARATAYQDVLDNAGAFPRDSVDARVVQDVVDADTGIIESQSEVGGWPDLLPNYPHGGVTPSGVVVRRVGKVLGGWL